LPHPPLGSFLWPPQDEEAVFHHPVDLGEPELNQDYAARVPHAPIDLGTMQRKVKIQNRLCAFIKRKFSFFSM